MVLSLVFKFFDYVRFSQVYFSVEPQKYLTLHSLWLQLVLWIFHVQVKWFGCMLMTRESQVCQHKSLAMLCCFFTQDLKFTHPVSCCDILLSALWGYDCAACCRCILSFQVVFFSFLGPVMFFQWFHHWLLYWANCCPLQFFSLSGLRAGRQKELRAVKINLKWIW